MLLHFLDTTGDRLIIKIPTIEIIRSYGRLIFIMGTFVLKTFFNWDGNQNLVNMTCWARTRLDWDVSRKYQQWIWYRVTFYKRFISRFGKASATRCLECRGSRLGFDVKTSRCTFNHFLDSGSFPPWLYYSPMIANSYWTLKTPVEWTPQSPPIGQQFIDSQHIH